MSAASIFCILEKISREYNIPYNDLLVLASLKQKQKLKAVMEAIVINETLYYYDENNNHVYNKKHKLVGMLCKDTFEIIAMENHKSKAIDH